MNKDLQFQQNDRFKGFDGIIALRIRLVSYSRSKTHARAAKSGREVAKGISWYNPTSSAGTRCLS